MKTMRWLLPLLLAAAIALVACGEPESEPISEPAADAPVTAPTAAPTPTPEPTPEPFTAEGYLAKLADEPPSSVRMHTLVADYAGAPAGISFAVETISIPAHTGRQTLGLDVISEGEKKARIDLLLDGDFIYINPPGTERWLRTLRETEGTDATASDLLPIADQTSGFFAALPDPATVSYEGESDCDGVPCHILVGESVTLEVRVEDLVPIRIVSEFNDGTPVTIEIIGWDEGLEIEVPGDARDVPASAFWQLVITIIAGAFT